MYVRHVVRGYCHLKLFLSILWIWRYRSIIWDDHTNKHIRYLVQHVWNDDLFTFEN